MANWTLSMSGYRIRISPGFTLIELMVSVAVLAIVLALAVPNFQDFVRRNRLAATTNDLVSALALARSEAVKRAARVSVASADWRVGWQVFVDTGTVGDASDEPADNILRVYQPNPGGSAAITLDGSGSGYVSYLAAGAGEVNGVSGGGSFSTCLEGNARVISINTTGRVSTAPGTC
jgi:type IV fimbrial biogenesis protein FimT